jgi:hypothetical protein
MRTAYPRDAAIETLDEEPALESLDDDLAGDEAEDVFVFDEPLLEEEIRRFRMDR